MPRLIYQLIPESIPLIRTVPRKSSQMFPAPRESNGGPPTAPSHRPSYCRPTSPLSFPSNKQSLGSFARFGRPGTMLILSTNPSPPSAVQRKGIHCLQQFRYHPNTICIWINRVCIVAGKPCPVQDQMLEWFQPTARNHPEHTVTCHAQAKARGCKWHSTAYRVLEGHAGRRRCWNAPREGNWSRTGAGKAWSCGVSFGRRPRGRNSLLQTGSCRSPLASRGIFQHYWEIDVPWPARPASPR